MLLYLKTSSNFFSSGSVIGFAPSDAALEIILVTDGIIVLRLYSIYIGRGTTDLGVDNSPTTPTNSTSLVSLITLTT